MLPSDQRGPLFQRIVENRIDMGAFEVGQTGDNGMAQESVSQALSRLLTAQLPIIRLPAASRKAVGCS